MRRRADRDRARDAAPAGRRRRAGGRHAPRRSTGTAGCRAASRVTRRGRRAAQHEAVLLARRIPGEPLHSRATRRSSAGRHRAAAGRRRALQRRRRRRRGARDVRRREAKLPYGYVMRELRVVPRLARHRRRRPPPSCRWRGDQARRRCQVDMLNNTEAATNGDVALTAAAGWRSEPAQQPFTFARAGERATYRFTVTPSSIDAKPLRRRGRRDGRRPRVPRRLRADRPSRSRGALPVSRRRPRRARHRRHRRCPA